MPFNTSTRLYSLLSERINVHICNEKGLTQFVSNLCFSYGSRHCLFWVSRSCDKKTRTVMSVFFSLVGVARLELAALRSRTVRATKLRYTPFIVVYDCF